MDLILISLHPELIHMTTWCNWFNQMISILMLSIQFITLYESRTNDLQVESKVIYKLRAELFISWEQNYLQVESRLCTSREQIYLQVETKLCTSWEQILYELWAKYFQKNTYDSHYILHPELIHMTTWCNRFNPMLSIRILSIQFITHF